jgi:hypothetical protein
MYELNGLANIDMILKMTDDSDISPELKKKIQEQVDLSIIYFRTLQTDSSIKWHEIIAKSRESK